MTDKINSMLVSVGTAVSVTIPVSAGLGTETEAPTTVVQHDSPFES